MAELSMDNVYRLWESTPKADWESLRTALQTDAVWDELGDEEGDAVLLALDQIEREELSYPDTIEEMYTVLNQYISE